MSMPVGVCDEFFKLECATRSLAVNEIAAALSAFQDEVPAPEKNKTNTHLKTKYADLSSVITTIRPYLRKHNLVYAQPLDYDKDQVIVYTELVHVPSGQFIRSRLGMSLSDTKPQTAGIVISYARRYSLLATLAMPHDDEDNDGEMGEKKKDPKYPNISVSEPKPAEPPKGNATSRSTAKTVEPDSRSASAAGKGASSAAPADNTDGHDSLVKKAQGLFGGRILDAADDSRLAKHSSAPLADDFKDDLWDLVCQVWPSEGKHCLNNALKERKKKPVDFRTITVGEAREVHALVSELLGNDGSEAPF